MITRFAPAPTGYLHLGHVVNALHVWQAAHDRNGRVLLRMEDHDRQRSRPEFETAILEDLAWLGFSHDGPLVRQSERDALYRKALQPLIDRGLVYGCKCSRAELVSGVGNRESGVEVPYRNTCRDRDIPLTDDVGWRLRIEPGTESFFDEICGPQVQDPSSQCGDLLIRDRLGNWTYQFAVTVDDHLQKVTDVIRGIDLLPSTGRQIRLARLLGRTAMPRFAHHGLVMKSATEKLSKSDGDTGVRDLRAAGWSAEAVVDLARRATAVFALCVALCVPTLAQTTRFIVPDYLAPQFTAPPDASPVIVIAGKDEPGARMIVTGRTLIGDKPVPGVSIYVFHTDTRGNYSNSTLDNKIAELNPRLHGALRTDAQGRYRYETTRPGSYENGPAHVHYVVRADGYEPLLVALQFQDDPIVVARLKFGIPLFDPLSFKTGPCQSRPDCVLTQPVTRDAQGVLHVVRDIQMVKK